MATDEMAGLDRLRVLGVCGPLEEAPVRMHRRRYTPHVSAPPLPTHTQLSGESTQCPPAVVGGWVWGAKYKPIAICLVYYIII